MKTKINTKREYRLIKRWIENPRGCPFKGIYLCVRCRELAGVNIDAYCPCGQLIDKYNKKKDPKQTAITRLVKRGLILIKNYESLNR